MKMIHHQALNGMEINIVVHMMLYLLFCSTYGQQNRKNGKKKFQESNQYLYTLHDGFQKYLGGVDTLEAARDSVRALLYENDPLLFPSGHTGCSVSALTTQMFYPVYKVPQLHLQCSHCNHTIMINSNHIGRLMHVAHSATGSISQILENYMRHQSQQVC